MLHTSKESQKVPALDSPCEVADGPTEGNFAILVFFLATAGMARHLRGPPDVNSLRRVSQESDHVLYGEVVDLFQIVAWLLRLDVRLQHGTGNLFPDLAW